MDEESVTTVTLPFLLRGRWGNTLCMCGCVGKYIYCKSGNFRCKNIFVVDGGYEN